MAKNSYKKSFICDTYNMEKVIILEKAKAFAVKVIKVCEALNCNAIKSVLAKQLTKSATSIGANIHEATYAASGNDFINKLQIALKECHETEYWLQLGLRAEYFAEEEVTPLLHECGVIRKMIIKSINTANKTKSDK